MLEIALCSLSLCSVQVVEQGGRGCTHIHLYSGLLSGLRSRDFSFSHRGGFPRKKCLSHLVIAYTIPCYRRSIFLTRSREHEHYIPLRLVPTFPNNYTRLQETHHSTSSKANTRRTLILVLVSVPFPFYLLQVLFHAALVRLEYKRHSPYLRKQSSVLKREHRRVVSFNVMARKCSPGSNLKQTIRFED